MVLWFWIVGWFVTAVGLAGNSSVMYLIAKRQRLHTTANWFVLSLTIADVTVNCGYFPAAFVCNSFISCNTGIRFVFLSLFADASICTLIAMIVERYIAIVFSLKYLEVMTARRVFVLIAFSWMIPVLLFAFRLVYYFYYDKLSYGAEKTILTLYTVLFELIPTIGVIAATLHIFLIARRLSLQTSKMLAQFRFNQPKVALNVQKRCLKASTVKVLSVIVAIFVACYGTESYISICETFELCAVSEELRVTFSFLFIANSALNPLAYAFLKEDMRREFKVLLRWRSRVVRHID